MNAIVGGTDDLGKEVNAITQALSPLTTAEEIGRILVGQVLGDEGCIFSLQTGIKNASK